MTKTLKKNKTPLIAGLILVLALVAYFYRDNIKSFFAKDALLTPSKPTTAVNTASTSGSNPSTSTNTSMTNDTVLKKGSRGAKVKELQVLINKGLKAKNMGFPNLAEDGIFGAKTESRLQLLIGKKSISINEFKQYK